MSFDLDAPEPGAAEVELAPGLTATVRPLTGQLDARAQAEVSGMAADLRSGAAAAARFGLDAGAVSDQASLTGLPEFARMVLLGSLCITRWDVTRGGQPVPVSEASVGELFNKLPVALGGFRAHLYSAMAERVAAGERYAASLTTTSGGAATSAGDAPSSASPAHADSPAASPASSAPPTSTPPVTRKPSRRGAPSQDTRDSGSEPASTAP